MKNAQSICAWQSTAKVRRVRLAAGLRTLPIAYRFALLLSLCFTGCGDIADITDISAATCQTDGAACDPRSQCGCEAGQRCLPTGGSGPLSCQRAAGNRDQGAACTTHSECGPALSCHQGHCRAYCDTDGAGGCEGGTCTPVAEGLGIANLAVCVPPCSEDAQCEEGSICGQSGICVACTPQRSRDACDAVAQCGCDESSACVWHDDGARCEQVGEASVGEACDTAVDCADGNLCRNGLCADYCHPSDDCFDTKHCTKLNNDVAICGTACDFDEPGSCALGSVCAQPGECVVPTKCADERIGDGICDGPSGTRRCASDKDDAVDCCAALQNNGQCDGPEGTAVCATAEQDLADCCHLEPYGEYAECDALNQCGCVDPQKTCQLSPHGTADTWSTACLPAGEEDEGNTCRIATECKPGLSCWNGLCTTLCDPRAESNCFDGRGVCLELERPGVEAFGVCFIRCDPAAENACPEGRTCKKTDVGYLCGLPPAPSCEDRIGDETCDGPGGTGICETDSDDMEDCMATCPALSRTSGACNPALQCGCGSGMNCAIANGDGDSIVTTCLPSGNSKPGAACELSTDCAQGATCVNNVCSQICEPNSSSGPCAGRCIALAADAGVGICQQ